MSLDIETSPITLTPFDNEAQIMALWASDFDVGKANNP
jgi:hypothetical protein